MVSYTGVWSTCMKKALNSSNLYCWIHHIPQMVSFYITYNTSEPKRKGVLTPIKYDFVAYVTTIEIRETDNRDKKRGIHDKIPLMRFQMQKTAI